MLSCVLPTRVPKYMLQLCTLHYVLLLHIHSHYITRKYMTAAPQLWLLMVPSQRRGSGSFLGRSLGEFMSGEMALRERFHFVHFEISCELSFNQ